MKEDTDIETLLGDIEKVLTEHGFGSQNLRPSEREAFKAQLKRLTAKKPPSPLYLRQRARHQRLPGEIIEVLKDEGPLTSSALAERLREDARYVAILCQQLAEEGWLVRDKKAEKKRLFFTPVTGEVVHGGNYDRLQRLLRELREMVDQHALGPSLAAALQRFFAALLARPELESHHKQIARFRDEMLEAARSAESESEIRAMVGLRPFFRQVVAWKPSDKALRESRER
jgi:hypothetical protein